MKCNSCESKNLFLYSHSRNEKVRIHSYKGDLYLVDPRISMNWKVDYNAYCKDCQNITKIEDLSNLKVRSAKIDQEKLVLDLDQTLISTWNKNIDPCDGKSFDFEFSIEKQEYGVMIRPHFKKFIAFAKKRFKEIHIHTAATKEYAKEIVKGLGIEKVVKTITSRETLHVERTLTDFDREYIKKIDNAIVLEDKPQVVWGENNTIFQVKTFWGHPDDTELLEVLKVLKENKKSKVLENQWQPKILNLLEDLAADSLKTKEELSEMYITHILPSTVKKIKNNYFLDLFNKVKNGDKKFESLLRYPEGLRFILKNKQKDFFEALENQKEKKKLKEYFFSSIVEYFLKVKDSGGFENLTLLADFLLENKKYFNKLKRKQILDLQYYAKEERFFMENEEKLNKIVLELKG